MAHDHEMEEKISLEEDSSYNAKSELLSDRSSSESNPSEPILRQSTEDIESQSPQKIEAAENYVSTRAKLLFLAAYFFLNLFLTLSNKSVLGTARFPWLLTAVHCSATSIGCFAMLGMGALTLTPLGLRENLTLFAFSFLFTVNIAISNVSLAMVSVPFHQIMRSTCPVVTILIYKVAYGREYSRTTYLTMIPLVFGVALSTVGDYYATLAGFFMTFLGVVLASVKTVATNRLMTGSLKLSALEVLLRMSPLAAIQCVIYAYFSGEADQFRAAYTSDQFSSSFGAALFLNAVTAFLLNVVGFQANKMAGALTITVCGNVKQALTILFGIILFHVEVGLLNAVGMLITIAGAVWYSKVELDSKRASK
ncbi:GDP-mannose transporter GONST5 [Pseudocercospora fuligena]|uniref:GDP-mannose transporter GONST5 n=1 Tax=Pseudocercospora fuligena TaxID=685502 RepID=A0A8H6RDG5_9PEZI|nr:GDP-mannose transporter GONST5 [Pseudocercospora fuligena]